MSNEEAEENRSGEAPIEGGEVGALKDIQFHEAQHRAETARSLAKWLVAILGGSVALHYVATTVLIVWGKEAAVESLGSIFNAWLPAISSLVSAAATYYFTRDQR